MIVQIYALTSAEDAAAVADLGADHIGVVVGKHGLFFDELTYAQAGAIFAVLPPAAVKVALSMSTDTEEIFEMAETVRPDIVHVSVHVDEVPPMAGLRERLAAIGIKLMRAIPVTSEGSIVHALRYQEAADYLLLDSKIPGRLGATGQIHDWNISRRIVEPCRVPIILAGGLSPENVAEAIRVVRPWGVDSFPLTSRTDQPLRKDLKKVRRFIAAARGLP